MIGIIDTVLLLGILWISVGLAITNRRINKFIAVIEKREKMNRKEVEKEMDKLNEINGQ